MTTDSKFNAHARDREKYPFGYFSDAEVDRLVAEQSVTPDPERRRELVQQANLITSEGGRDVRVPLGEPPGHAQGGQLPARKPHPRSRRP